MKEDVKDPYANEVETDDVAEAREEAEGEGNTEEE